MCPLLPALIHFALLPQDAVHRTDGTVVLAFIQQRPIDLARRQVSDVVAERIERLVAAHRLAVQALWEAPIRQDQGRPLMGWYVILRREA